MLSADERTQIHERTLHVLATAGMRVDTDQGREILRAAGAQVDEGTRIIRFPAKLVEESLALAPRAGGAADLRVLDRGPGVPPDHRERIFEKFHRVDETLTAEKHGAGLGLSIARQLARGLGGELRYEPRAGGGAAFVLELP